MSTIVENSIEITEKALGELLAMDVTKENFLRLWVVSGGCQGLTYQAAIDEQIEEGDQVIYESDKIKVVSDPESAQYLPGLVIDFSDDLAKSGFRFLNPNAKASCGCGSSFCSS